MLWLDTALVVLSVTKTLIVAELRRFFVPPVLKLRRDYQSCVKPQHSKGFALAVLLDHYQAYEGQDGFPKALIKRAVFFDVASG